MYEFIYEIFGLIIKSNIPLLEIRPTQEDKKPDFIFDSLVDQEIDYTDYQWLPQYQNEKYRYRIARRDSSLIVSYPQLADFVLSSEMRLVCCYSTSAIPLETIRHLFLDQIIPIILSQRGKVLLHASAVITPLGAIVFIGESGQGKSTLCAGFGQQGFPILTDDCLLLEQHEDSFLGISSYPGLRLWPDTVSGLFGDQLSLHQVAHYFDKKRLGSDGSSLIFYKGRVPIAGIYCLDSIEKTSAAAPIAIQPLGPAESLIELARYRLCLGSFDRHQLSEDCQQLSLIINSLGTIHRLDYPRDLALLPRVLATVLEHSGRQSG